jgi:gamma-glutamyl phosphate reductase
MKELEIKSKAKTEIKAEKEIKTEHRLVDRIIPHPGHKMFEIKVPEMRVKLAEYEKGSMHIDVNGNNAFKEALKIIIREGHLYVSALNEKNALKKLMKGKNGTKIDPRGTYLNMVQAERKSTNYK